MQAVGRGQTAGGLFRQLLFALSAIPLAPLWFVTLTTAWSLCLGFLITPLVIPLVIVLALITRGFAAIDAGIAKSLLDVELEPRIGPPPGAGFWARFRALLGADFWREQAYLLIRWFVGFPLAIVLVSLIGAALAMVFAPTWVPFVHGGADIGFWKPHTFVQSLVLVPVGLLLLAAALLLPVAIASAFRPLAAALLVGAPEPVGPAAPAGESASPMSDQERRALARQRLQVHAVVYAIIIFALVLIWALTSRSYFWPVWVALPLAAALAIRAWFVLIAERPSLIRRFLDSRTLTATVGVGAVAAAFFVAIWAITGHGYFWPVWPILTIALVIVAQAAVALLSSPREAQLTERIETLESTRAGAVDAQESELRRIERDLHDGAQARLVSLGMSLGMAEHTLKDDPGRAGELLAEARVGAEQALRELRDLARGIHPPVLADRGLQAAIAALANSSPTPVSLSVDVGERPPATVESAAYFVVAEALANAAKHARATRMEIDLERVGDTLALEVSDNGVGGADPAGSGLRGLRHRVEALDGTLQISSPRGGPTTIRAELPCG